MWGTCAATNTKLCDFFGNMDEAVVIWVEGLERKMLSHSDHGLGYRNTQRRKSSRIQELGESLTAAGKQPFSGYRLSILVYS